MKNEATVRRVRHRSSDDGILPSRRVPRFANDELSSCQLLSVEGNSEPVQDRIPLRPLLRSFGPILLHLGLVCVTLVAAVSLQAFVPKNILSGSSNLVGEEEPLARVDFQVEISGRVPGGELVELQPDGLLSLILRATSPTKLPAGLSIIATPMPYRDDSDSSSRVIVVLDDDYVSQEGSTVRVMGRVADVLPLQAGVWQLTFVVGAPSDCHPFADRSCSSRSLAVRIEGK